MPVSGKLYTYPNNFRAHKALIAAKYSGAGVEVDSSFVFGETNKEKAFLSKFPLGKVPAFEGNDGQCLFESNAIAYHLANEALRGKTDLDKALVQQWISFADSEILPPACTLTFPILGIMQDKAQAGDKAKADLSKCLAALDKHLLNNTFLVGERISLADIVVSCNLLLPYRHALDSNARKPFANVERWMVTLLNQPEFKDVLGQPQLCEKVEKASKSSNKKSENKESKKETPSSGEPAPAPEKEKSKGDPLSALPKGKFDMDDFKRFYSNNDEEKSVPYFWDKFDSEHYSIWKCDYKYEDELTMVFMSCNLIGGMFQRLDKLRKNAFASVCLFGENNNSSISGIWVWRGPELAFELSEDWQIDYTSYDWKKLDPKEQSTKDLVEQYFKWQGADTKGRKFNQGKIFK